MADKKKLTVYPSLRALEILGQSAPALNQGLDCWAQVIAEASADNSKLLVAAEWAALADVLNGTLHEPGISNAGEMLAASVEDGDRFDGLGEKWFGKDAAKKVPALGEKLRGLDYAHAWAVIVAVQFFWHNHETISVNETWWTVAFRREHNSD